MIASLRGKLRKKLEDRVVVESSGVGYEIFLPPVVIRAISQAVADDGEGASDLQLVIYYHATRDQPRPVLIGFLTELDREFFEKLITVKDIGPLVAARSLTVSVADLAAAIARQDEKYLRRLPGIGPQKARNIVAQLQAKVAKFALMKESRAPEPEPVPESAADQESLRSLVWEVLVKQLGHRPGEAAQLITEALRRRPEIAAPEELFDEIYRGRTT
jgi:Holliday junction DNA helicase RuvA